MRRAGVGLGGVDVTLHRVGADTAGILEVRASETDGAFRFRLSRLPNPAASSDVYFASVEYQGILYFGPPVATPADLDSLYVVEVHDTARVDSGDAPVAVQTRTLVLEAADEGWWVTDLFELRNDGDRTLVTDQGVVWRHPLPPGAADIELGESDLEPDAVRFTDATVETAAPIPPGTRVYLFRYRLDEVDVRIPQRGSERFELLIREPAPVVEVEGLRAESPVSPEGTVTYRRFAGLELASGDIHVREDGGGGEGLPLPAMAAALALALAGLALWGVARGRRPEAVDGRSAIVLQIARLDEAYEATADPSAAETARYRAARERLAVRLRALD